MKQTIKLGAFLIAIMTVSSLFGQESVNSGGGDATGVDGEVGFSVGQLVVDAATGPSGSVSPGVQNPYEVFTVTDLPEELGGIPTIELYPNPTVDQIILSHESQEQLTYHLYDELGNEKLMGSTESSETTLSMSDMISGTYILKVSSETQQVKEYQIIKL